MKGGRGGGSTPSYKEAVASRGKKPLENARGTGVEGKRITEEETKEPIDKDQYGIKDKEAHREHMGTYPIICKFMGLWPTEKALQSWIKYHWEPKGSIDLHLGSKVFFTVVFTNIEDKDKIFEGGPYFYVAAGLYMRPWMMNFVPEKETFTSVPVWVRLYSLPLDYWQNESLAAIGNKLGRSVKASEATRRGKYTSFARICVEMDLSRALLDEVILEVFNEEWVQTVDYEHIPFRCCKCHEHGHIFRDCPLNKEINKSKISTMKKSYSLHKEVNQSKGGKRGPKNQQREGQ
eukprot:PITA_34636